jgi:hypothetical protein
MYGEIGAEQLDLDHGRSGSGGGPDPPVSGHRARVDALDDDVQPESELLGGDLMGDGVADRPYGVDERGPRNNRLSIRSTLRYGVAVCCARELATVDFPVAGGPLMTVKTDVTR